MKKKDLPNSLTQEKGNLYEEKPAGNYEIAFDGSELSSEIYFYKLRTGDYSSVKKIILLK
jgi:hypothetical protein